MRHPKLLTAQDCALLVVDIQEVFAPHIFEMDRVIERSRIMIEAAKLLQLPIVVTQQYPKGLGQTVPVLREALGPIQYYDKVSFSCLGDEAIKAAIAATGRRQVLMVGIEGHVCIAQTAYDALEMGLAPYLAVDAISSRRESDARVALERLANDQVVLTTVEAAIFEMLQSSRHEQFRAISQLIK